MCFRIGFLYCKGLTRIAFPTVRFTVGCGVEEDFLAVDVVAVDFGDDDGEDDGITLDLSDIAGLIDEELDGAVAVKVES